MNTGRGYSREQDGLHDASIPLQLRTIPRSRQLLQVLIFGATFTAQFRIMRTARVEKRREI